MYFAYVSQGFKEFSRHFLIKDAGIGLLLRCSGVLNLIKKIDQVFLQLTG